MKPQADKVAGQETLVAKFLEEHRPLLKEPELSFAVLETMYVQGAGLLKSLSYELEGIERPTIKAANALTDALNERPRVAPKIARLEKKRKRLRADFDRVNAAFELLEPFIAEVKARIDAEYEEDGTPKGIERPAVVEEAAKLKPRIVLARTWKKLPWWKRLLGVHQEESIDTPILYPGIPVSERRESLTTPSQTVSDHEDYEKLLTWYEQNLEVLEKAVAGMQSGEPGEWQQVIDELLDRMGWCDRHMDTVEQRNADMAGSELVSRREGLASRRSELGES